MAALNSPHQVRARSDPSSHMYTVTAQLSYRFRTRCPPFSSPHRPRGFGAIWIRPNEGPASNRTGLIALAPAAGRARELPQLRVSVLKRPGVPEDVIQATRAKPERGKVLDRKCYSSRIATKVEDASRVQDVFVSLLLTTHRGVVVRCIISWMSLSPRTMPPLTLRSAWIAFTRLVSWISL